MGLIQKLKSALGLDGAQSPEPGTTAPRDVDVTVEREPSSESEDAVKGTETATPETPSSSEPDLDTATEDEPSYEEAPIEEAEPVEESIDESTAESADESTDESADEPADGSAGTSTDESAGEPTDESADVPADPVTDISGIGPAYGERLADAGVETVADLAAADPDELEAATDISASRIEGWIDAAAEY